jgi:glycosyltransferase involved in cell wall biosynthesis
MNDSENDIRSTDNASIKLSVHLITYNQESFIRQAIEGVLMQKVNFTYEILIGDDFSTDNTKEIISEYAAKFQAIKPHLHTSNLGPKGLEGKNNFLNIYNACTGKYIALLDGDDYWTDPYKLQKQVDFLESNPDYAICFHKVKILQNGQIKDDSGTEDRFNQIEGEDIGVRDLLKHGNFINTASVMFRNTINHFPLEFSLSPVGDYFLYIMLTESGSKIKRMDDVMAVYRKGVGAYDSLSFIQMMKKALIYESCILSYLKDQELRILYLKEHLKSIERYRSVIEAQYINTVIAPNKIYPAILKRIKIRITGLLNRLLNMKVADSDRS